MFNNLFIGIGETKCELRIFIICYFPFQTRFSHIVLVYFKNNIFIAPQLCKQGIEYLISVLNVLVLISLYNFHWLWNHPSWYVYVDSRFWLYVLTFISNCVLNGKSQIMFVFKTSVIITSIASRIFLFLLVSWKAKIIA